MTVSTAASYSTCDGSSINGQSLSAGQVILVGHAPVVGPPGTTDCWLQVNADVTLVGF